MTKNSADQKPLQVKQKTLQECRDEIHQAMTDAGHDERNIEFFLAGATLLGHLRPGACAWWREHRIRQLFKHIHPTDMQIEEAGRKREPAIYI